MIRSITSSLRSFKALHFTPGLNIVVAERCPEATDRDTRNSAGKTCMIELIHFLLGASAEPSSMFRNEPLVKADFTLNFDLAGSPAKVTRSGREPTVVRVEWDPPAPWRDRFPPKGLFKTREYTLTEWNALLGQLNFGIENPTGESFYPTFRMLIGYFARRDRDHGFIEWSRSQEKMQPWQQSLAISYLLGLDWQVARKIKLLHDREEEIKQLRKMAKGGVVLNQLLGDPGPLRSELAIANNKVRRLEEQVVTFKVHPEYEALETEATELTRRIASLSEDDVQDRRLLEDLDASLRSEAPPRLDDLARLYQEAGVVLPANVQRRYEDVQAFHESVVRNRRQHLEGEMTDARRRMEARTREKKQLDERRAQVMGVLQSHGALAHYTALEGELSRLRATRDSAKERLARAEEVEGIRSEVDRTRIELRDAWRRDVQDHAAEVENIVVTFQRISAMLFEEYGRLEVLEDVGKGVPFRVIRHGDAGKGIRNMQIFCFDMTLASLGQKSGRTPGFLVHDSHLFDGTDERQVGHALNAGATLAHERGFQYIVTMNTDALPTTIPDGFDLKKYINPTSLTDAREDGGLFGIRFEETGRS